MEEPIVEENPESVRNWLELPTEVTATILHKVGAFNILDSAQMVCTSWLNICKDPSMWKSIEFYCSEGNDYYMSDAEDMAFQAVDRSCGQLAYITLEFFPSDEFIHYLAQHASQLRRLRIHSCQGLTGDVLKETASKFSLLEELEVQSTLFSNAALEAVGSSCPRMRSLKFNFLGVSPQKGARDDIASIIADTMPQLRSLQLIGNRMTIAGLKVILDKCLCLESLDLRSSYFIGVVDDTLAKICSERIKMVKYPGDPIGNYEFGEGPDDHFYTPSEPDSSSFDYMDQLEEIMSDFDNPDMFFDEDGYSLFSDLDYDYDPDEDWLPWM